MTVMASDTLRAVAEANLKQALGTIWAYPAAADTLDMLALLDDGEKEKFYDSLLAGLGYGLVHYEPTTRVCETCGNWRCDSCGWTRTQAERTRRQLCRRCGRSAGTFSTARHRKDTWEVHNPGREWPEAS